ncbi:MAG: hypothetical protein JWQ87_5215, partial [Candidatus Sulfotelmatobacter sp.]|nr:hypothetical protein [Candidatus Sulfotelmatobacter sp.]
MEEEAVFQSKRNGKEVLRCRLSLAPMLFADCGSNNTKGRLLIEAVQLVEVRRLVCGRFIAGKPSEMRLRQMSRLIFIRSGNSEL